MITCNVSSTRIKCLHCVFPYSAPHVLPNFNSPYLIHCPSVLLVNCSESSGYGCNAGFVFFSVITGGHSTSALM